MKEVGIIKGIASSNLAEVELKRLSACQNCKACGAISQASGRFIMEAINEVGAKQNDTVSIEVPPQEVISTSSLVFLLPVALIFLGYALGQLIGLGAFFAVVFCGLFFISLPFYDRFLCKRKKVTAKIIEIIAPDHS